MIPNCVSTIIPVYNRAAMLRDSVGSVLAQTHRPIEILIVDDGSTDDTPWVCQEIARHNPDIVRVTHQQNAGPGRAREIGRLMACGEFIQYLDSDDFLHPTKFERQVACLRDRPDCGVAYCMTREGFIGEPPVDEPSFRTGESLDYLFPSLLSGRCWQTVTPLFRRSVCDRVGPWSDLRQEEDWEYDGRVAALRTRLAWCPVFLADFRHHKGHRAGGNSLGDPQKMRWRARAHQLLFDHASRAEIDLADPHMQRFARSAFLLARQCGAGGLAKESRDLFELSLQASLPVRQKGIDFRLYRLVAAIVGWCSAGRMSCWADRYRQAASTTR